MIIDCPNCSKRISSKYKTCPGCGLALDSSGEGLDSDAAARRLAVKRRYRRQAQMYAAILLFVAGCAWLWGSSGGRLSEVGFWPTAVTAAGAIWYISIRVYMIFDHFRR